MKYIGSNYAIKQSIKFNFNLKIGQGVFRAMRRIAMGSDFDRDGSTPLLISKASTPPPPV